MSQKIYGTFTVKVRYDYPADPTNDDRLKSVECERGPLARGETNEERWYRATAEEITEALQDALKNNGVYGARVINVDYSGEREEQT